MLAYTSSDIPTYTFVERGKRTLESLVLELALAVSSHASNGLERALATETLVENVTDSTAEPVTAFILGGAGAVLHEGRSHACRGKQSDGRLHVARCLCKLLL